MNTKFDCDIVNGLSNAVCGRIDLLEKILGVKVREGLKYADIQKIVKSGFAKEFFDLGDEIMTTYTATDGTEYDFPWRIVDFRDVYWENDPNPHPGMVLMSKYVTAETIAYDAPEMNVCEPTETIAVEGWYYYGTNGSVRQIVSLNLSPGDNIPHDEYNTIYKNGVNERHITTSNVLENGFSNYSMSAVRQWLNSDNVAGEWWTPQHLGDGAPDNADTINGFLCGFENDFLDTILPVRISTYNTFEPKEIAQHTYDKFFIPSLVELYIYNNNSYFEPSDNSYFEYWKNEIGTAYPGIGDTTKRKLYKLTDKTSEVQYIYTRSYSYGLICKVQFLYINDGFVALTNCKNKQCVLPCCVIS